MKDHAGKDRENKSNAAHHRRYRMPLSPMQQNNPKYDEEKRRVDV
jgi:hypothetical protein